MTRSASVIAARTRSASSRAWMNGVIRGSCFDWNFFRFFRGIWWTGFQVIPVSRCRSTRSV
jgi:hypothetical protein